HELFVAASSSGYLLCSAPVPVEVQAPWVNFTVAAAVTDQGKPVDVVVGLEQVAPFEGAFKAELQGLPKGVTTEPQEFTKDTTELKFPLVVAEDAPVGKFSALNVNTIIETPNGGVRHASPVGELKVQAPLPAALQAQAPPPAPADAKP